MNLPTDAIGVFDSGLGGLTAVKELKKTLPNENIIYFGDTGRVPYGTRSVDTIIKYADEDLRFLLTHKIKAVLVACGTVSSVALDVLKQKYSIPIFGVIKPAAQRAAKLTNNGCIGVLGTPATIKNAAYEVALKNVNPNLFVLSKGCPLFVPLVENGYINSDNQITRLAANEYLSSFSSKAPDVIILGCTHYPIIKDIIINEALNLFGKVSVVDSGACAVNALKNFLQQSGLINNQGTLGKCCYYVSDDVYNFNSTAKIFLGKETGTITKVDLESILQNEK